MNDLGLAPEVADAIMRRLVTPTPSTMLPPIAAPRPLQIPSTIPMTPWQRAVLAYITAKAAEGWRLPPGGVTLSSWRPEVP
ncbi:hypothetical protein ABW16_01965 [Mycolicibacter heraklionensis]|uniref:Uncharacterized protein n=1 Tax=Mycolicibacter heraklionensis TaxID=512402 RepID=A0ABR5FKW5_9MYCO|nr:hypothetical protein [Mycolicibacter heraklionensis]KLO31615.1 hypothetical protein ABW16_01965 [Mycolicibacter heraklionensis]